MKILAIETSCDETAIAILEVRDGKFEVKSNVVLSQIKIHKKFGGVVPNLAMREHRRNLPIILKRALKEVRLPLGSRTSKFDAIAVTYGPGLEPALWEGINFAENLAKKWKKPLVAVNHLEGHIYASWLLRRRTSKSAKTSDVLIPKFPLLALIVSGGHTELVLMKKHLNYKILGETRDDAAGEAFDKVARMLGLGYPGGPKIAKLAEKGKPKAISFPRPMINSKDFDFSFSGLKTAVLYYLCGLTKREHLTLSPPLLAKERGLGERLSSVPDKISQKEKMAIAASFQQAVVDVLVKKAADALRKYNVKSLVVGGGVAANQALRHTLDALIKTQFPTISLHISPLWLCGDNAAMIAVAGYFKFRAKKFSKPEKIKAQGNLKLS